MRLCVRGIIANNFFKYIIFHIPYEDIISVCLISQYHNLVSGFKGVTPLAGGRGTKSPERKEGSLLAKEFLLVDGYNIIHAWSELREMMEEVSLESARLRLMDILSNYKGMKQTTVILVFDGYLVKGNIGTVYEYHNIFVVYTKEAETADHYIERVVTAMPKQYRVRVATGDGLEQLIIYGQGAIRMTARELLREVTAAEAELRERFIQNRPPKNNILSEHLEAEELAWLEDLRRKK